MNRFWIKVKKTSACWIWRASRSPDGYGWFRLNGRMMRAHIVAYEFLVGTVPSGLELDHLCSNRGCVNPAHLEPVTHVENVRRSRSTGRQQRFCKHGHDLKDAYVYRGSRHCRECNRLSSLRYGRRSGKVKGVGRGFSPNGRSRSAYCSHGHEFTPENTRWYKGRYRYCRICTKRRNDARVRRKS